ncbi:MAG: ABC transporter ATP-binding protein [Clostridiales bacterium]|nr:ABC transporter ATP-binding protein [Clostridiales bacterium]
MPLIRDIEIGLNKGQILTLIGPNGAGKSTILKTLTKYLRSVYGTVYVDGRSIDDMSAGDLSRGIAVVLTESLKTELMTCENVVASGRYPYTGMLGILAARDKEVVRDTMERLSLWELRERDFNEISDGQRQRVLLARAVCQEPQIIVLDEPTSYLDIRYGIEILNNLRKIAKERGITVIMSLHDLNMAQKASDLVMCVKGEYITYYGEPRKIFKRELISELYELTNGSYNPFFGSFELEKPRGRPDVFVIAGGGTGIDQYRILQKKGIPFATGILHENDIDFQVAYDLAGEIFAEKSFQMIGEDIYQRALKRLETCGAVINCLTRYGFMNLPNKELYERAVSLKLRIAANADSL